MCLKKLPEERPDVDTLLSLPLTQRIAEKARRENEKAMIDLEKRIANKPFFDIGTIEMAMNRASIHVHSDDNTTTIPSPNNIISNNNDNDNNNVNVNEDRLLPILEQIESEHSFRAFVSHMKRQLNVRDRMISVSSTTLQSQKLQFNFKSKSTLVSNSDSKVLPFLKCFTGRDFVEYVV